MIISSWKTVIALITVTGMTLGVHAAESEFPSWLGGKPDTVMKPDRCMLYDWFFKEANSQTEGQASEQDLARRRVINIANKLADHHKTAQLEQYSGEVKYLVLGEIKPFHFTFHIKNELLEQLVNEDCPE